jgi:hypothetical protein
MKKLIFVLILFLFGCKNPVQPSVPGTWVHWETRITNTINFADYSGQTIVINNTNVKTAGQIDVRIYSISPFAQVSNITTTNGTILIYDPAYKYIGKDIGLFIRYREVQ